MLSVSSFPAARSGGQPALWPARLGCTGSLEPAAVWSILNEFCCTIQLLPGFRVSCGWNPELMMWL